MSTEFVVQVFIYILLVVFIVLFTIVSCKWQDAVHRNYELQDENSDLIERNEKLYTYLDETRAVVITQNKIIADLRKKAPDDLDGIAEGIISKF